jgi:hypothetical protein
MWIKPEEVLLTALWFVLMDCAKGSTISLLFGFGHRKHFNRIFSSRSTERANPFFKLQRRRGQDEEKSGLASLLIATWDSVTESKVCRINLACSEKFL